MRSLSPSQRGLGSQREAWATLRETQSFHIVVMLHDSIPNEGVEELQAATIHR